MLNLSFFLSLAASLMTANAQTSVREKNERPSILGRFNSAIVQRLAESKQDPAVKQGDGLFFEKLQAQFASELDMLAAARGSRDPAQEPGEVTALLGCRTDFEAQAGEPETRNEADRNRRLFNHVRVCMMALEMQRLAKQKAGP